MAADVINYIDITDEWLSESNIGSYIVCDGIMIDEKLYLIGENGVYMHERLRTKEVEIAKCLSSKYKKQVILLPEISGKNQNVKMADLIVNGKLVEIKTIDANGSNTIKNAIKRAKGQANELIINAGDTLFAIDEIIEAVKKQFNNLQCAHMDVCIIMKYGKVVKVFKRKKIGISAMLKHDVIPIINHDITILYNSQ